MSRELNEDWNRYQNAHAMAVSEGDKDLFANGWYQAEARHRADIELIRLKLNALASETTSRDAAEFHHKMVEVLLNAREL